ncbi:MAG: DUF58 domain-containing protein [Gammaproteobacteria bacterium]|nr:DUF58 domain-containing protein [Gammaproteobacteria bacterium]
MSAGRKLKLEEFYYHIQWQPKTGRAGLHRSRQTGAGFEVNDFRPFGDGEDPRRFDVRAGLKDPLGRLFVRRYKQQGSINVIMLADMSASMNFTGTASKQTLMASFLASLALSVCRNGDVYSFLGADERYRENISLYKMRRPEAGIDLAERINELHFDGRSANGLLDAVHALPGKKSLVFLVSDFYLEADFIEKLALSLSGHMVVPVVLRDSAETLDTSRFGIAHVYDSESRERKMFLLRERFLKKLRDNQHEHDQQVFRQFARYGMRPLMLCDEFSAERVSHYFLGH